MRLSSRLRVMLCREAAMRITAGKALMYGKLSQQNNGGVIDPWLAKSWEHNDDCTEWTFSLRDDAYFTDGVQFNADVCLKNIERWGHGINSTYTTLSIEKSLPNLDKMEKVDDYTVKFTFTQPITTLGMSFPTTAARCTARTASTRRQV